MSFFLNDISFYFVLELRSLARLRAYVLVCLFFGLLSLADFFVRFAWLTCEARAVEHQKLNQTTPRRRLVEFLVFNLLAFAWLLLRLLDLLSLFVCLLALLGFLDLLGLLGLLDFLDLLGLLASLCLLASLLTTLLVCSALLSRFFVGLLALLGFLELLDLLG